MKKAIKLIAFSLALLMAFSSNAFAASLPLATSQPQAKMANGLGDVSGDGKISILDSAFVFFHIIGLRKLDESTMILADVNGDGKITFDDMREITQYSFDKISVFTADTQCWTISNSPSDISISSGITDFETIEIEKDENGNNIYRYVEFFKNANLFDSTSFSIKATQIDIRESTGQTSAMDLSVGVSETGAYSEVTLRGFMDLDILNGFKIRIIYQNGAATVILPQINSYVSDLEEDFISIDDINSMISDFSNLSVQNEYQYFEEYYSHSYRFTRGGTEYFCDVCYEPLTIRQYYFTADGKFVRSESIRRYYTKDFSITNFEYFGTEIDKSMFEIPALYIKISIDDLKAFFSENSATQTYYDYLTKERQ